PDTIVLRQLAKNFVAREVAAGRRSLVEAAGLFEALNRLPPAPPPLPPYPNPRALLLPGRTEAERLCPQAVVYLKVVLADGPPGELQAVLARLEAEFREELHRHGEIRLPDPSSLPPAQDVLEQVRKSLTAAERQAMFSPPQRGVP